MPTANVTIRFDGGRELDSALRRLDTRLQERALKKAVQASSQPVVKVARALVPTRYGFLRRALGVRVKRYRSGVVTAIVGARYLSAKAHRKVQEKAGKYTLASKRAVPALYAHLVEHGTKPHGQRGVVLPMGLRLHATMHPGAKTQPFLKPAMDQTWRKAVDIMGKTLWKEIRKVAR